MSNVKEEEENQNDQKNVKSKGGRGYKKSTKMEVEKSK